MVKQFPRYEGVSTLESAVQQGNLSLCAKYPWLFLRMDSNLTCLVIK